MSDFRFRVITIKILVIFSTEQRKTLLKFYGPTKDPPNNQCNFEQKNRVGGITQYHLRIHYKITIIETMWYDIRTDPYNSASEKKDPGSFQNPCIVFLVHAPGKI